MCGQALSVCFCGASSWSIIFAISGTEKGKIWSQRADSGAQSATRSRKDEAGEGGKAASLCPASKAPGLSQGAGRGERNSSLCAGAAWVNAWEPQAFITLTN